MGTVVSRGNFKIHRSVNTPDYPEVSWIWNPPSLGTLIGTGTDSDPEVSKAYWVAEANDVREMTTLEKALVNADPEKLMACQGEAIVALTQEKDNFISHLYDSSTRDSLAHLQPTVTGEQKALLDTYFSWHRSVYDTYATAVEEVNAATSVPEVEAVNLDLSPLSASNPNVTVSGLLSASASGGSGGGPSVEVRSAFDATVTTLTANTLHTKVQLPDIPLAAGTYRILVSYGWNLDATNSSFESVLRENSGSGFTPVFEPHLQEPKDAGGWWDIAGTSQRNYITRIVERTLEAGTYSWDLQFRPVTHGVEASMWEALISIQKVG